MSILFLTGENLPGLRDSMVEYMEAWYNRYTKYQESIEDSQDAGEDAKKEYDLWRYRYPADDIKASSERMRRRRKIDQLKEELARLEKEENEHRNKS